MKKKVSPQKRTNKGKVIYIHGDANKELDKLIRKKQRFKLIMTSPPYNMDREYEKSSSIEEYLAKIDNVIEKLIKLLSRNGSICWQVGNYIDKKTKEVYPLDVFHYSIFKKYNLILRNRIVWHFGHGLHAKSRFSGRYETILWFTKKGNYTFNLDKVRVDAKYPGKRHYKGDKKGQLSGNPKGKNPSDVWTLIKKDWENELWEIPNVKSNHKEKTIHPCQYPVELVERCILAMTNKGDWILDPYAGVGSTMIGAIRNNRNAVGIEKYVKYIKVGKDRILKQRRKKLNVREIGTPIYKPDKNSSVAKKPKHFR